MEKNIDLIKRWISKFVIGLELCPFAKREFDNETIHYHLVEKQGSMEDLVFEVWNQMGALIMNDRISTSIIIFEDDLNDFEVFLDMIELIETLIDERSFSSILQLAHFHPDYQFENTKPNAPENYTNRSPLPIIQLLRVDQVAAVIDNYANIDLIPSQNINKMNELGLKEIQKMMRSIA